MGRLKNKIALVTGAANGIGRATAQVFLEQGATVVLVDKDEQQLQQFVADCGSSAASWICADLRDDKVHEQYVSQIKAQHGGIDIAVFNAGIEGINIQLEDYPVELFDEVLALNMRAVWLGLKAVIPVMKQAKKGSIILTSSVQGLAAIGGTTAYTTSKHALVGMMKGASLELAPHNIRVNAVHPGYVATPMMQRIHETVMPDHPDEFEKLLSASVPMKRYAQPREVGQMMAFLASDDASYSTGSSFVVDGGMLAALP